MREKLANRSNACVKNMRPEVWRSLTLLPQCSIKAAKPLGIGIAGAGISRPLHSTI